MKKRPWIWIVLFFALFIAGLTWFVIFAHHHAPQEIPLIQ